MRTGDHQLLFEQQILLRIISTAGAGRCFFAYTIWPGSRLAGPAVRPGMGPQFVDGAPTSDPRRCCLHPAGRVRDVFLLGDDLQFRRRRFGATALVYMRRHRYCRDETPEAPLSRTAQLDDRHVSARIPECRFRYTFLVGDLLHISR